MTQPIPFPAWERPYWQPSEEEILLHFYVFGNFKPTRVPSAPYGSDGLPEGMEATSYHNSVLKDWEGYPLKGALGDVFKDDAPEAYAKAIAAPQVMVVRGQLKDTPDTGYLRDTFGVLAGLLDIGGEAIVDAQILSLFGADDWRRRYLVRDGAPLRSHVLIMCDDDEQSGKQWVHTRGMRKFGRPDVSVRNVPTDKINHAGVLCENLIQMQALGAHFEDGQALDVEGMAHPLVAQVSGDRGDPNFNNSYIAYDWPDEG